ncbi:hypothetical protein [Saccharopolyspora hattusasensis]|uniref:hypothetical protein n=1 Tax=Saccharopolyspora hattusasensis TaxID=1128679 RepID=UPI003D9561C2
MRAAATRESHHAPNTSGGRDELRGEVLGQTEVEAGDENAAARDLLARLGRKALEKVVITADAKHAGATFVSEVEKVGAFWLLPVEGNRPGLYQQLKTLPWTRVRLANRTAAAGTGVPRPAA